MRTAKRVFIVLSASFVVAILGWVVLIGAVYAWGGVATVQVKDSQEGLNLYVPVPMALVEVAVAGTSLAVPDEDWEDWIDIDIDAELGEWGPMVRAMLEELDKMPDVVLVEVEDGDEHVKVYKKNGKLRVEVDSDDVSVRVSLPMRSATRTLSRLSRIV